MHSIRSMYSCYNGFRSTRFIWCRKRNERGRIRRKATRKRDVSLDLPFSVLSQNPTVSAVELMPLVEKYFMVFFFKGIIASMRSEMVKLQKLKRTRKASRQREREY